MPKKRPSPKAGSLRRFFAGFLLFGILAWSGTWPETVAAASAASAASTDTNSWISVGVKTLKTLPEGAALLEEEFTKGARLVRMRGVHFSSNRVTFRVVVAPEPRAHDFPLLLEKSGAFAGTNGGYFHPDYRPLGLVLAGGEELHGEQRARLLSGLLFAGPGGLDLQRAGARRPTGVREGLQGGPFLMDGNQTVAGLEATKTARRTFLATDGKRNWFLGVLSSCTLAEAGDILAQSQVFGQSAMARSLNLDGGSSTALWVRGKPGEEDFLLRPLGAVSNYIGLFPVSTSP